MRCGVFAQQNPTIDLSREPTYMEAVELSETLRIMLSSTPPLPNDVIFVSSTPKRKANAAPKELKKLSRKASTDASASKKPFEQARDDSPSSANVDGGGHDRSLVDTRCTHCVNEGKVCKIPGPGKACSGCNKGKRACSLLRPNSSLSTSASERAREEGVPRNRAGPAGSGPSLPLPSRPAHARATEAVGSLPKEKDEQLRTSASPISDVKRPTRASLRHHMEPSTPPALTSMSGDERDEGEIARALAPEVTRTHGRTSSHGGMEVDPLIPSSPPVIGDKGKDRVGTDDELSMDHQQNGTPEEADGEGVARDPDAAYVLRSASHGGRVQYLSSGTETRSAVSRKIALILSMTNGCLVHEEMCSIFANQVDFAQEVVDAETAEADRRATEA